MRSRIFILLIPTLLLAWTGSSHAWWFEYTTPEENLPVATDPAIYESVLDALPFTDGSIFIIVLNSTTNSTTGGNNYQIIDKYGNLVYPELQPIAPGLPGYLPYHASIVPGDNGSILACWASQNNYPPQGVWVQKIDSEGNILWGDTGYNVLPLDSLVETDLVICPDGYGGLITAITRSLGGTFTRHIIMQRVDYQGQPMWGDSGIVACSVHAWKDDPKLVPDEQGGAYAVWEDQREPYQQNALFGQHVDDCGYLLWEEEGLFICYPTTWLKVLPDWQGGMLLNTNPGTGYNNTIFRIGSDGHIIWELEEASWFTIPAFIQGEPGYFYTLHPYPYDIRLYAQRFDVDGNLSWPRPGAVVEASPDIVYDGGDLFFENGFLLAVYEEATFSGPSYFPWYQYAQKLDTLGNRYWGNDGVQLTYINHGQLQWLPFAVGDGEGGVTCLWTFLDVTGDVWAKHVTSEGVLGGPDPRKRPVEIYPQISGVLNGTVQFTLPEAGRVRLDLYNLLGRKVAVIGEAYYNAGSHTASVDLAHLTSGVYFLLLKTVSGHAVKKVVLVR
jgi:hypothetical protein